MVRAPCCEKMGMKKGPWTAEEDQILIDYIQRYGHGNWRALPKQAGLLRCGKSCRLRWTNYLRPDLKRGNFSKEEEDTIIQLHELLGNRWSAIAARLPGRTDNEIKNVWHTHLKKRLKQNPSAPKTRQPSTQYQSYAVDINSKNENYPNHQTFENNAYIPVSPQQSASDLSSSGTTTDCSAASFEDPNSVGSDNQIAEVNGNSWANTLPVGNLGVPESFFPAFPADPQLQFPVSSLSFDGYSSYNDDSLDFWLKLFIEAGSSSPLPEI